MSKSKNKVNNWQNGFSITEMSIVLAAVAAVVLVIFAGSILIEKARYGAVLSKVGEFSKAVDEFEKIYGGLPGDLADVSALPGAPTPPATAGNGVIDSGEQLIFWQHLSLAGLISGSYDGTSAYTPGKGMPEGPIQGTGYKVVPSSSGQEIRFEVAGISGTTGCCDDIGAVSPTDAKELDQAIDDGNPTTGTLRAIDSSSGTCINSNQYVTSELNNCILQFVTRAQTDVSGTGGASSSCSTIGATRVSISQYCPEGYIGRIMETCRENGTWQVSEKLCEAIKCQANKTLGEQRDLVCPSGYNGTVVSQICAKSASWVFKSTNCVPGAGSCSPDGQGQILACIWGQKGGISQICSSGSWLTSSNSCTPMNCSGSAVGNIRTGVLGCGANYTSGTITEVCALDESWKPVYNNCIPNYAGPCTPDTTRNVSCPPGETGVHAQKCIEGDPNPDFWVTTSNTCKPTTCGGEPIASSRPSETETCPYPSKGVVAEICNQNGEWDLSYLNCTPSACIGSEDTKGNAAWPNSPAGTSNVTGTCLGGFIGTPKRNCKADGTWEDPTVGCVIPIVNIPSSGLTFWLDANDPTGDGTTQYANNASVTYWADKSGNGNYALQSDATRQPLYKTSMVNGKPSIDFSDDFFTAPNTAIPGGSSPYTVFAVIKADTIAPRGILGAGGCSTGGMSFKMVTSPAGFVYNYWGCTLQTNTSNLGTSTSRFIAFDYTPLTKRSYIDGGTAVQITGGSASHGTGNDPVTVGVTEGPEYWDGLISEIIVYNRLLTACEHEQVNKYIGTKWGVTVPTYNAPAGICSNGLIGWYTPDNAALDFDCVSTSISPYLGCWKDLSGFNNHLKQGNGSSLNPRWTYNPINSKYVFYFDGNNDYMYTTNPSLVNLVKNDYTIIMAYRPVPFGEATTNYTALYSWAVTGQSGTNEDIAIKYIEPPVGKVYPNERIMEFSSFDNASHFATYADQGSPYGHTQTLTTTQSGVSAGVVATAMDGAFHITANPGNKSTTKIPGIFYLGAQPNSGTPANYFKGYMHEIVIYNRVLTSQEITTVENYLKTKYSFPTTPAQLFGLTAWYDMTDPNSVKGDINCTTNAPASSSIYCILDKSGNNRHAQALAINGVSADATRAPTYGLQYGTSNTFLLYHADFDGSNDVLTIPNAAMPSGDSSYTVVAAVQPDTLHYGGILGAGNYTVAGTQNVFNMDGVGYFMNYWDSNWGTGNFITSNNNGGVVANGRYIVTFKYEASNPTRTSYLNNNTFTTRTGSRNGSACDVSLGAAQSTSGGACVRGNYSFYFNGKISQLAIFNRTLTDFEREEVNSYFNRATTIPIVFEQYTVP